MISTKRTRVTFVIMTLASLLWFSLGWRYGVEYQGYRYTLTTSLISVFFAAVIGPCFSGDADPNRSRLAW
jgi:uncharacterized membrane protein YbhN (UPF0104 family)